MKSRFSVSHFLIFSIVLTQFFGSFETQVSAATQIAEKPRSAPLCVNPAGNSARAAQDDRCLGDPTVSSSTGKTTSSNSKSSIKVKTSAGAKFVNPSSNSARAAQDDRPLGSPTASSSTQTTASNNATTSNTTNATNVTKNTTGSTTTGSTTSGKTASTNSTTSNTVKTPVGASYANPSSNSARAAQDDRPLGDATTSSNTGSTASGAGSTNNGKTASVVIPGTGSTRSGATTNNPNATNNNAATNANAANNKTTTNKANATNNNATTNAANNKTTTNNANATNNNATTNAANNKTTTNNANATNNNATTNAANNKTTTNNANATNNKKTNPAVTTTPTTAPQQVVTNVAVTTTTVAKTTATTTTTTTTTTVAPAAVASTGGGGGSAAVVDTTPPTLTFARAAASSSSGSPTFTITGNEAVDCTTLSTVSGTDFTWSGISAIAIAQTNTTTCTITVTSTATVNGATVDAVLTRASTFSMSDTATTPNAQTTLAGSPLTISVDRTAPTLTFARSAATSTSGSPTFTVTGNEAIDCSTLSTTSGTDFTWTGISAIAIAQTNTSTCTITVTSTATVGGATVDAVLTRASDFSITDSAGNAQTTLAGSPLTISVDRTAPTVTLARSAATSGSATITFTVTGDEAINCATLSTTSGTDFTFTNISAITGIVQTNTTTCTITATSTGVANTLMNSSLTAASTFSVADTTGNTQSALTGSPQSIAVTVDTVAATLTLARSAATANSQTITFTVTGDKAIDCTTLSTASGTDFTFTNISAITGIVQTNTTTCTITATSTAVNGGAAVTSTLTKAGGFSMTDANGNTQATLTPTTLSIDVTAVDTTPPTVTLARSAATAVVGAPTFTVTGNEQINCATLSTTNGTDFTFSNITSIAIVQTNTTTCTITATTTATTGGATVNASLTAAASFSMADTATTPNAQTSLTITTPGTTNFIAVTIPIPSIGSPGVSGGTARVFYVATTPFASPGSACTPTCRYLEWENVSGVSKTWCNTTNSVPGTGTAIGTGNNNTVLMRAACGTAVGQILELVGTDTNWFIPSRDELNELFRNRASVGWPTGTAGEYFSSSQVDASPTVAPPGPAADWAGGTEGTSRAYTNRAWRQWFDGGAMDWVRDKSTFPAGVIRIRAYS